MHNSFTLDLKPRSRLTGRRLSEKNTIDREAETLDSGLLATTSEFRRYPKEETIVEIQPGANLRQMREKRRLLEQQCRRMACRLQYHRNKEERMLNSSLVQQYKIHNSKQFQVKKQQDQRKTIEQEQKRKYEQWTKAQQVQQFRKKLQNAKRISLMREELRKKKELDNFKRKFHSQKSDSERLKQQSIQQTREKHNTILRMKQEQSMKKKMLQKKKQQSRKSQLLQKIQMYEEQTAKTLQLIDQLKIKESVLEERNRSCGKVLMNILENFKKLESL